MFHLVTFLHDKDPDESKLAPTEYATAMALSQRPPKQWTSDLIKAVATWANASSVGDCLKINETYSLYNVCSSEKLVSEYKTTYKVQPG
jgi:hypothetical protein